MVDWLFLMIWSQIPFHQGAKMTTDNQSCTNDHLYSLAYFATRLLT